MSFSWLLLPVSVSLLFAAQAPPLFSPAERQIQLAQGEVSQFPKKAQGHNRLALAYCRRGRETADSSNYQKGEEELRQSLVAEPGNFEAKRTRVCLLLGEHEYSKALAQAKELNGSVPDDLLLYELLAYANIEVGNYAAAEKAAQILFDLRTPAAPALALGASLRDLFGDLDGAVEFMGKAYRMTSIGETEDRAFLLTRLAHFQVEAERFPEAEKLLTQALQAFPEYPVALAGLAKVEMKQGKFAEAVALDEKVYRAVPRPANLYALAIAQDRAGMKDEASATFREFESKGLAEIPLADNSNRELVYYYADFAKRPDEALRIATLELERRHDAYTRAAYAWALHAAGKNKEAGEEMHNALAVGLKDPELLDRAKRITETDGTLEQHH